MEASSNPSKSRRVSTNDDGNSPPDQYSSQHHTEVFTETHSEEEDRHNHHESGHSDHAGTDSTHPHHKESVTLTLADIPTKFRVFLGDDITLKAAFPQDVKVIWRHNADILSTSTATLNLGDLSAAMLGDYECALVDGSMAYRGSLVKNKSPFKWCEACSHRNHAHAKQCIQCHQALRAKLRPPKRRCESLTMKNYEDAIVEKLRSLKEAHGENVDTLCIISRRHYNRTLTTVYKSPGAATTFLQQSTGASGVNLERLLSDSWTRWIDHHYLVLGHGTRSVDHRRRREESVSPPAGPQGPPVHTLDGSINALVNTLQPQQATFVNGYPGGILEGFATAEQLGPHQSNEVQAPMPHLLEHAILQTSLPSLPLGSSHFFTTNSPYLQLLRAQPMHEMHHATDRQ